MDPQVQKMIDNLPARTGHDLNHWFGVVDASGLAKHGAIRTMLKSDHGMGHGFANLVASLALKRGEAEVDLITAQYEKKPAVRPFYDAVIAALSGLDFEVIPKKTAVALKRNKQFAYLQPSTKSRLDVGIQLKGDPDGPRLKTRSGMTSHVVRVTAVEDVDDELVAWLTEAWNRC